MARVIRWDDIAGVGERRALIPAERSSELALHAMRIPAGAATELSDDLNDTLLFAHEGACAVGNHELDGPGSLLVPAGDRRTLVAGPDGASLVCATLGAGTDLHAPMGAAAVSYTHLTLPTTSRV